MKKLLRSLFVATLLISFSTVAFAQKFCRVTAPSPFKHSARIVTVYDTRAKRMKTTLEHPQSLSSGGTTYLYAEFFYEDPRLGAKPGLDLYFRSVSKETKYRNALALAITLDGNSSITTGQLSYASKRGEKNSALEVAKVTISYDDVVRITSAKSVDVRLGPTSFRLSKNHLESLREIASLMTPSRKAPATSSVSARRVALK